MKDFFIRMLIKKSALIVVLVREFAQSFILQKKKIFEQIAYIVQNKNQRVLRKSTNDGELTAIAGYVLHNNGVVCGTMTRLNCSLCCS